MGIRFLCPNEHRLNVKAFLAGKRGICPHCGVAVDIPLESQIESRKKQKSKLTNSELNGSSKDHAQNSGNGSAAAALLAEPVPTPGEPTFDDVVVSNPAQPDLSGPVTASVSIPVASPHMPVRYTPPDPIDEAPDAIWYVRPPTGGQFGPAAGDIMRKWLDEGRVSADSLIWREGWGDWQIAGPIFPELNGASPQPPTPPNSAASAGIAPSPSTTSGTTSAVLAARRQPRNNGMGIALVAILGILSLALLGLLCYVVFGQGDSNAEQEDKPTAMKVVAPYAPAEFSDDFATPS